MQNPVWDDNAETLDTYSQDVRLLLLGAITEYRALLGPQLLAALPALHSFHSVGFTHTLHALNVT